MKRNVLVLIMLSFFCWNCSEKSTEPEEVSVLNGTWKLLSVTIIDDDEGVNKTYYEPYILGNMTFSGIDKFTLYLNIPSFYVDQTRTGNFFLKEDKIEFVFTDGTKHEGTYFTSYIIFVIEDDDRRLEYKFDKPDTN